MAISARAVGSWVAANATTQTVTLPTHAAGDMLLVRVAFKHATMPTTVTCGTSGWSKIGQYNNGTTVSGNGTGSVIVAVFYKEATSASETNPVITYHASVAATPSAAVAVSYQKGAGESWVTPVGAGGSIGTSTALSATITSHISTTAGDMVDFFHSQGDNNTLTVPTFTQAGLTLGTVAEYPATALSSATSNDIDADGGYRLVSSGTSTAAAVVTGTATAGDQGSAWTTRLRVEAIQPSGSGGISFGFSESGTGQMEPSGSGGLAFGFSESGTAELQIIGAVGSGGGGDTTVVEDTFTDTAGTSLYSHTPNTGGAWSRFFGQESAGYPRIQSGVRVGWTSMEGDLYDYDNAHATSDTVADGYVQVNAYAALRDLASSGVIFRGLSGPNFYAVYGGSLYRYNVSGGWTLISSVGGSGYRYRVQFTGSSPTTIKVEQRSDMSFTGSWTLETSDNTAANQASSGKVGLKTYADGDYYEYSHDLDDFKAVAFGAGGTAGNTYLFSMEGTGSTYTPVTGTGGIAFGFSESGTGSEDIPGSGGLAFPFSMAGDGTSILNATGTGGLEWPFSMAGDGTSVGNAEGSGGLAFPFSESGTGWVEARGSGGVAFGFSESGAGTEDIPGSGGSAYAFSESGTGTVANPVSGSGGLAWPFSMVGDGTHSLEVTGTGGLLFTFLETGAGEELFAGAGALSFGFSMGGDGASVQGITGTGGVAWPFSMAGAGVESMDGSGGLAFPFSQSGTGAESMEGSGGLAWPFAMDAVAGEDIPGTGALVFTFAEDGSGFSVTGDYGMGGLAFGFTMSGEGEIVDVANDLATYYAALMFGMIPKWKPERSGPL